MKPFLKEVIEAIQKEHKCFDDLVFVLPNKRAGRFLKQYISAYSPRPIFCPKIYSIEALIGEISGLEKTSDIDLLVRLYETFLPYLSSKEASFESFVTWGATLLSDFNEMDRNLVRHTDLFNYLTASQRLKVWGGDNNATPLISNDLKFLGKLSTVYESFQEQLLKEEIGYQGLVYKHAVLRIDQYISENCNDQYHFIGFNALNTAEEHIFQSFFEGKKSVFWWDIDSYFLNDTIHEAGFFIREYFKRWPNPRTLSGSHNSFLTKKNIKITGVPKSISQAKYVAQILIQGRERAQEGDTALVLSDEALLKPVLNSIPPAIQEVNVTMGLPLKKTVLFDFFDSLFDLYLNATEKGWFFKEVAKVLSNPYSLVLTQTRGGAIAARLNHFIKEKNSLFVDQDFLDTVPFPVVPFLGTIFTKKEVSGISFVAMCLKLIDQLMGNYQRDNNEFELHSLYRFFQLFGQLQGYVTTKPYLSALGALRPLFNELVLTEQVDFRGEPLGGLQIMGVLESRNLDFETIIITSVNEGILPAGKNQNSFIPFDIKKEFGLPTYKEKDAIYAYHFYRLLQRAKNIHIIYNTEPDILHGSERSRFISQILTDFNSLANTTHEIASPEITIVGDEPKCIQKTPALLKRLEDKAQHGFSPSSLSNYIKDPYKFYTTTILGLHEVVNVEETIAHNTFGTIVHNSLEELYMPLIGQKITKANLNSLKNGISSIVKSNFEKYFLPRDVGKGQNLIALHVIQKYLSAFIDSDILRSQNHEIVLLDLEKSLKVEMVAPQYQHPVFLKGKVDRLEHVDGTLQILDYKTGNVMRSEVEIMDLEHCVANEKHSKAFQLLCYALMQHKAVEANNLFAGIVPIKKLNSGILLFAQKEGPRGPKHHRIDQTLLNKFEKHLTNLILEILNPEIPFMEAKGPTSF